MRDFKPFRFTLFYWKKNQGLRAFAEARERRPNKFFLVVRLAVERKAVKRQIKARPGEDVTAAISLRVTQY